MSQTIKKVTNAVPKNKKCWIAKVEHLRFPGVGKILRICTHELLAEQRWKKRGSSLTDIYCQKVELTFQNVAWPVVLWFSEAPLIDLKKRDNYVS